MTKTNQKCNILVGRFQPLTIGHLKCVDYAYRKLRIPTILCMIETLENKTDERHPFPSSYLLPVYEKLLKTNNKILGIVVVKNANILDIENIIQNKFQKQFPNMIIQSWTAGTDRIDTYKKMLARCKDRIVQQEPIQLLEVVRSAEDVSATLARKYLIENDYKKFYKIFIPVGLSEFQAHAIFTQLRSFILHM